MLSCFICGRDGSVIEPTSPPKLDPSFEKTKSSSLVSLKFSACAGNKHPSSLNNAAMLDSTTLTQDKTPTQDKKSSDRCTIQKETVISTVVVEGEHTNNHSSCVTQAVKPDEYNTKDAELDLSSDENSCNKVNEKDLLSSNMQDEFGDNATTDAGNELPSMLEDNAIPHYGKSTCIETLADADEEITTINAIHQQEDTGSNNDANVEKPIPQFHEAHDNMETYGIVSKFMDMGYQADKLGVKPYIKHKEPAHLFSYGISDQQRDFMFLCAGLVIQAVGFQLKSIVEVVTTLILLGYRTYFFTVRVVESLSHIKEKLKETRTKLSSHILSKDHRRSLALQMEKLEIMKPLLITGAKKMGWGCVTAAYVLTLLTSLLVFSFVFSYFAVKGSSRQEPIHITKELHFDYTKSHPVASLDLLSLGTYRMNNPVKGVKVNPMASILYRCDIVLTLPESGYNRNLGIFQVTSELLSETGEILLKASQPCMLQFKSNTVHYVKFIFLAIPLIAGVTSETQTLSLHLLEWQQDAASPAANASVLRVLLVPRAGRAIINGLPELYKAEIQVDSSHWMPSSASSSSIKTLVMWIGLSFLLFGFLSSFCMYRFHQNRSTC